MTGRDPSRFRKHVKRLTEGSPHLTVLPRAVRKHEIEQAALLARFLPGEQILGVTGEFENLHALIHVGLLGFPVAVDFAQAARLFLTPLPGHLVVKIATDLAVELVDVHCLDPGLEAAVFRAEPLNRLLLFTPLVGITGVKGLANPFQHLFVEAQPP